jgi:membrane protein implicated in regulation of membrane protease activity
MIVFIYKWLKNAVFRREAQTSRCSRCTAAALLLVVVLPPPPLLVVVVAAAALLLVVVVVAAAAAREQMQRHPRALTVRRQRVRGLRPASRRQRRLERGEGRRPAHGRAD